MVDPGSVLVPDGGKLIGYATNVAGRTGQPGVLSKLSTDHLMANGGLLRNDRISQPANGAGPDGGGNHFSSQPLLASWVSPRSVEVKVDGMDVEVTSLYPGPAMLWKVDLAEPLWAGAGLPRNG